MEIRKAIPYKNDPEVTGYEEIGEFLKDYAKSYLFNVKSTPFEELAYDDEYIYVLDTLKQKGIVEKNLIDLIKEKGFEVLTANNLEFPDDSTSNRGVIHLKQEVGKDDIEQILFSSLKKYEDLEKATEGLQFEISHQKLIISGENEASVRDATFFISKDFVSENKNLDHPHPSPFIRLRYSHQNNRKGFFYQISEHCVER